MAHMTRSAVRAAFFGGLMIVVLLAAGCGERRSEQYRLEGDAYLKLGKFQEATDSYQKAETANPANPMAQLGLGRCLLAQQKADEALAVFQKAIEKNPALEPAYVQTVAILLDKQQFDVAAALTQKLEAANPERGGLLHALVLVRQGKVPEAVTLLTGLRDKFPKSVDVRVELAAALLAANDPNKAEPELRMVLDTLDPQSLAARMGLIDTYHSQGKVDAAIAESEKLAKEHPDSTGFALGLARSLLYAKKLDQADEIARKVLTQEPGSPWANYILGACLLGRGKAAEALPYLQQADAGLPGRPEIRSALAAARGEKPAGAQAGPTSAGSQGGPALAASTWQGLWQQAALGRLLAERKTFLDGNEPGVKETVLVAAMLTGQFPLAEEIAAGLPEDSGFRKALPVIKANNLQDLVTKFDAWTEQEPARQVLRDNVYALGLARMGARAKALQVLSKCAEANPDNGVALLTTAMVFRDARMQEYAARTYERLISKYPSNNEIHNQLYQTLREAGSMREAQRAAEAAYALFPSLPDAILNLAQASLDVRESDLAGDILEKAVKASPDNMKYQVAYVATLLRLGRPADAAKAMDGLAMPAGDAKSLVVFKALAAAMQNDWKAVAAVGEGGGADNPLAALIFAAAHMKNGDKEKAAAAIEAARAGKAKGDSLYDMLLTALGKAGDPLAALDSALAANLAGNMEALGSFTFAMACQRAQLYDAAATVLEPLESTLGGTDRFLQTYILCLTRADRPKGVVDKLKTLTQQHANSAVAWLGLALACRTSGDKTGELQALEKATQVAPQDAETWTQLAAYAERERDIKTAEAAYREVLKLRPDDAAANNNAAYCLLMNGGDLQQALAWAKKAKEKLPSNPSIAHTLGVAQLRSGDIEGCKQNLAFALELRPGDPTVMLDFGTLLLAEGKKDEGLTQITLAVRYSDQLGLTFERKEEAKKILKENAPATQ